MTKKQNSVKTHYDSETINRRVLILILIFLCMIVAGAWQGDLYQTFLNGKTL